MFYLGCPTERFAKSLCKLNYRVAFYLGTTVGQLSVLKNSTPSTKKPETTNEVVVIARLYVLCKSAEHYRPGSLSICPLLLITN